ncbi:hypothetical protein [Streptomyces sp. NPDC048606]|uniref:hypothetical protein n=1 Tax=Streptomyces sp. NPDC048606 TaxID=3154726 RepID=UPI003424CB9A
MTSFDLPLTEDELSRLADLADATGRTPRELAADAVRALLSAERERVAAEAARLALRHAPLLERLGR